MNNFSDDDVERFLGTGEHEAALRQEFGDAFYEELRATAQALDAQPSLAESTRQKVFILPGIMGSKLSRPRRIISALGDLIWLDVTDIAKGGVTKLKWGQERDPIFASGVLVSAYMRMKLRLKWYGFDAEFLPYDWRHAPATLGERLHAKLREDGVRGAALVCHSMGGLVARQMAALDPDREVISQVVTVGTPNFGSYSPVEVFRLTHELLLTLGKIDLVHTPSEMVRDVLRHFPGLLEMMPAPEKRPDERYFELDFWPKGGVKPLKAALTTAAESKAALPIVDDRFTQIIGIGEETKQRARIEGDALVYDIDTDGDGTVPRDMAELGDVDRYYIAGSHAMLCNKAVVIRAVRDLLREGRTDELSTSAQPVSARESLALPQHRTEADLRAEAEAVANAKAEMATPGDILRSIASPDFDTDPNFITDAGHAAGRSRPSMAAPIGAPPMSSVDYPTDRDFYIRLCNRAAETWNDNAKAREEKERVAERTQDQLAVEDEDRIDKYVSRLMTQMLALPDEEQQEAPESLREAMRAVNPLDESISMEGQPRAAIERVIGEAEEFFSVMFLKRAAIALRSVCRIISRHNRRGFGTGFMVAPGVLMTNWHVLPTKAEAQRASAEFQYELDVRFRELQGTVFDLAPDRLFLSNEWLDFAIVAVEPRAVDATPLSDFGYLPLIGVEGKIRVGQPVNIIQHPEGSRKQVVFRESILKHLPKDPDTVAHYTGDTKRGSSGSPVFSDRWEVVALHRAGVPDTDADGRWLNTDGTIWHRASDPKMLNVKWVANEGTRISRIVRAMENAYSRAKALNAPGHELLASVLEVGKQGELTGVFALPSGVDMGVAAVPRRYERTGPDMAQARGQSAPQTVSHSLGQSVPQSMPTSPPPAPAPHGTSAHAAQVQATTGGVSVTVPLTVTLSLGTGAVVTDITGTTPPPPIEDDRIAEYADRLGYDRMFLGLPVEMPQPQNTILTSVARLIGASAFELKYDHFSVIMNRVRRLAYVSAGNYRHDAPFRADRRDPFGFDPRLPAEQQAGNEFYRSNDLDRGHLFRRADGSWGDTAAEARRASDDTFHWTNIAPQHFVFNQSSRDDDLSLWGLIENHLVREAAEEQKDLCIFNGPVFGENDPLHRGLLIPQAYWKVAVLRTRDGLNAFAFVLSQESLLVSVPREVFDAGRFGVFQVKLRNLETLTQLDFGAVKDADVLERPSATERFQPGRAVLRLASLGDIVAC